MVFAFEKFIAEADYEGYPYIEAEVVKYIYELIRKDIGETNA